MIEIDFKYQGTKICLYCTEKILMKDIFNKFYNKTSLDLNSLNFIYNQKKIDDKLSVAKIMTDDDKKNKKMEILVDLKYGNNSLIKSEEIICNKCGQNAKIKIKDYLITVYDCKNNHKTENISFNEFIKTQMIDESKIYCDVCKNRNKNECYKTIFYFCNNCKQNLCPLCKDCHNNNHIIVNYELKNNICSEHGDNFYSFCQKCKKNLCIVCESEHSNHDLIYFSKMMTKKGELKENLKKLKNDIDKFRDEIQKIVEMLLLIMENVNNYYIIVKDIFDSFDIKKRNYQTLSNINEINNNIILKDLQEIIKEDNIPNKFEKINTIYNKMKNIKKKNDTNLNIVNKDVNNMNFNNLNNFGNNMNILNNNMNNLSNNMNFNNMNNLSNNMNFNDLNNLGNNINNLGNNMNILNNNMNILSNNMNFSSLNNLGNNINNLANNMNNLSNNMNNLGNNMNFNNINNLGINMNNLGNNMNFNNFNNLGNNMNFNNFNNLNNLGNYMNFNNMNNFGYGIFPMEMYKKEYSKNRIMNEFERSKFFSVAKCGNIIKDLKMINNPYEWTFIIYGAINSPYEGGEFHIKILFPKNFPEERPEFIFITPIYHLNIHDKKDNDLSLGHVCSAILNFWKPDTTIKEVIYDLYFFFFYNNPDSPCCGLDKAELFKNNLSLFNKRAKYFTKKYADPSLPYKEYDSQWDFTCPDKL